MVIILKFLLSWFFFYAKYRRIEKLFFHLRSSSQSNSLAKYCFVNIEKSFRSTWGSNPRPWNKDSNALPTELAELYNFHEKTVFANVHPFPELFIELFFLLNKI